MLILPDGNYKFLRIDKDAAAEIKMWVQQGGKMIVLDNAAARVARADWGLKLKKADDDEKTIKKMIKPCMLILNGMRTGKGMEL